MKNKILVLLIPVLCLTLGTGRAAADDEGWYALGGFVSGVVATKVYDHHKSHQVSSRHHQKSSGYYKTVRTKVWVPGYWKSSYDECGRYVKYFEPGYYTHKRQRVWVSNHKGHRKHSKHQYSYHGR